MRKVLFYFLSAVVLATGCTQHKGQKHEVIVKSAILPGDSAHYGLACDGSTDSILVFLPFSCDRLDTFDIIRARQQQHIYGRPHIGDELAVIVNPDDREEALMVINLEDLKGTWCYQVMPRLIGTDQMTSRMRRRMVEHIPDSMRQMLLTPREYTLQLKRNNTAMHYGGMHRHTTSDELTPIEYPKVRFYTEWHLYNGRLILKADTISGFSKDGAMPVSDTVDIAFLTKDSLVLRFADHTQSYYRKRESTNP